MTILASAIQNHQNKSSRALILKSIFEILQTASCQGIRVQSHRPILDIFSRIEDFEKNTLLQDLPIAIKDNFNVKSFTTTASSKILETYVSPYDATPVAKLREQNAILIPNINMDEFGMGSSMVNSSYGICRNPWSDPSTYLNDSHSPGGSSGANAAIVARGIVHASLASDTGLKT
jgi:aspartyl-tRNA(Asn)/glutamyl-tRNA(Gln) amidotransferase subunit A